MCPHPKINKKINHNFLSQEIVQELKQLPGLTSDTAVNLEQSTRSKLWVFPGMAPKTKSHIKEIKPYNVWNQGVRQRENVGGCGSKEAELNRHVNNHSQCSPPQGSAPRSPHCQVHQACGLIPRSNLSLSTRGFKRSSPEGARYSPHALPSYLILFRTGIPHGQLTPATPLLKPASCTSPNSFRL